MTVTKTTTDQPATAVEIPTGKQPAVEIPLSGKQAAGAVATL